MQVCGHLTIKIASLEKLKSSSLVTVPITIELWTFLPFNMSNKWTNMFTLLALRLVPDVLQGPELADAWALCPRGQMRHPRATVAGGETPEEEGRHRQTQCVWPLEEEVLCFPLHTYQGEEVPRQLLRLPVHQALVLLPGLLCRYPAPPAVNLTHCHKDDF